jgi:sugar-specific transcriptional regulator TrmB
VTTTDSHDDHLMRSLDLLGLTRLEAQVYLYIVRRGGARSYDIVSDVGVHQPQLYNIILSLERKGFVKPTGSRPKIYVPADPSSMFNKAIHELRSGEKTLAALYRSPVSMGDGSKPIAWFVRGRRGTLRTLQDIIGEASSEVLIEQPVTVLGSTLRALSAASRRGVAVYLLLYGRELNENLRRRLGEQGFWGVRYTGLGHYLLCLVDQSTCLYAPRKLFSGTPPDSPDTNTLVFREREVANFFNHNFFVAWFKAAEVLRVEPRYSHAEFTNQRSALYVLSKLLERGVKPEVEVEGKNTRTGLGVRLKGRVVDTRIEEEVYSFIVDTGHSLVEVGGENALVETVSAERIRILGV